MRRQGNINAKMAQRAVDPEAAETKNPGVAAGVFCLGT